MMETKDSPESKPEMSKSTTVWRRLAMLVSTSEASSTTVVVTERERSPDPMVNDRVLNVVFSSVITHRS